MLELACAESKRLYSLPCAGWGSKDQPAKAALNQIQYCPLPPSMVSLSQFQLPTVVNHSPETDDPPSDIWSEGR